MTVGKKEAFAAQLSLMICLDVVPRIVLESCC